MSELEPTCSISNVKLEVESPSKESSPAQCSPDSAEMANIWNFLITEMNRQTEPLKRGRFSENIWEEYREATGSTKQIEELERIFGENAHTLSAIPTDISSETIIKMHFVYQIPVERMLLESLKMNAEVVVGETNCLVAYFDHKPDGLKIFDEVPTAESIERAAESQEMSQESQEAPESQESQEPQDSQESQESQVAPEAPEDPEEPEEDEEAPESTEHENIEVDASLGASDAEDCKPIISKHRPKRQKFSEDEESEMWNFLLSQIKNPDTGLPEKNLVFSKGLAIWEEFKKKHKSPRAAQALNGRFRRIMAPNLHKTNLSNEQKLILYYALDIPVEDTYLERLRKAAFVRVDNSGCITMYRKKTNVKKEPNTEEQVEEKEEEVTEKKKKKEKKKGKKRAREAEQEETEESAPTERRRRSNRLNSVAPVIEGKIPPEFRVLLEQKTKTSASRFLPLKRVRLSVEPETSPIASDTDTSGHGREPGTSSPDKSIQNSSTDGCSSKDFLINMKNLATDLKAPQLEDMLRKIEERIRNTSEDVKLPIDRVKVILEAALAMIPN